MVSGKRENRLFKGMASDDRWTMLQWMAPCLGIYGQHKLVGYLIKKKKRRGKEDMNWGRNRSIWKKGV